MQIFRTLATGLLGTLALTSACTTAAPSAGPAPAPPGGATVLFAGDSIAAGQSVPMSEAFAAAGVRFRSIAAEGGGNVVGPNAAATWQTLSAALDTEDPAVVVYQITTYDWGTVRDQEAAYTRLASTVAEAGATLVVVTMPPIRPDDFYAPHMAELAHARDAAHAAVRASAGRARLLDAAAVWGKTFQQRDRSSDGVHTCPQGAARFTAWLLTELAGILPGFTPAAPETWANTGWSADRRFVGC
ncbi:MULTISPECIES: SGNH/GDSL hydrolase family protein [Catenuloplanes]|uniref:SGNH hydrolase-type esterase domain-containing protein n=1 Tax=Catenuloplanes niger TaxID=587534 RepID=A0AAE4CPY0_9ACTN|nr:SGNH/GDSL hydrolase family protein [Catenuloplanes niger]MDR7321131.1 hypothetical protein [Catenuloplanes niger]